MAVSVDGRTRPARIPAAARSGVRAAASHLATLARRAVTPHRAALTNLADIPLTAAGTGCIDYAAWHLGTGWGWLVTGISLLVLEHLIADDQ